MSIPTLTYFPIRGRGELARLVMVAANKHLHDVKIGFSDWVTMKSSLYGTTNEECLMIDQILGLKEDVLQLEMSLVFGPEDEKMMNSKKLAEDVYPHAMALFCTFIKENPACSGYVLGDKITLADLAIFEAIQTCYNNCPNVFTSFPELIKHREKIANEEGIRQYLENRSHVKIASPCTFVT